MIKSQNQNEESENTRSAFSFSLWFLLHESILLSFGASVPHIHNGKNSLFYRKL